jgi:PAS domain S-box-containing protein
MPLTRDRNRSKIAQLQFPGPRMNQFALLSGVAFGAYLLLGGHAVLVDPRSRTNRMLGWMSACLALWALSIVFVSTAPNEAVARDWARVGALGWTLFPPFVLQFSWALTRGGRAMHPWAAVVAFAPFVGTLAYQHAFVLEDRARFVQTALGWVPTYPDFLWGFFLFRLCYVAVLAVALVQILRWGRRSGLWRVRRQSQVIAWFGIAPFLVGSAAEALLRHAFDPPFPAVVHLLALTFVAAVAVSMARFRMMMLTSSSVATAVLEGTRDILILLDADGRVVDVNRRTLELGGVPRDELVGRPGTLLAADPAAADAFVDALLASPRGTHRAALSGRTAAGEEIPYQLTGTVIRDRYGDPLWMLVVGHDERTSRRLSSETSQRQLAQARLAEEKELLRVTLRSIGEGVLTTDIDGRVLMMNPVAETLTGWPQAHAAGRPLSEVLSLLDERTRTPIRELERATGEGLERDGGVLLRTRGGVEIPLAYSAAPMRDQADRRIGMVVVLRDISGLRRLEADLIRVGKMESLGVLSGGIAHDFNNLLTAILGYVQLARMGAPGPGPINERLSQAEQACLRAQGLTRQLLTFSQGGTPILRPVAVGPLVREVAALATGGSATRCEVHVAPGTPPALADDGQVHQVLHNLILNAVQAMSAAGSLRIDVDGVALPDPLDEDGTRIPAGRWVRFRVSDRGPGIAPADLGRIFEPFFSTKPAGTGLGLATVYSIVRRHGGAVTVRNLPEGGCEFRVWLPASDEEVAPQAGPDTPPEGMHRTRVLIMDDKPLVRDVLRQMLDAMGYVAVPAADGGEALRLHAEAVAQGRPFDVLFLDYAVPDGMGGADAIRAIRAVDADVPAVLCSGYASDDVLAGYRDHGFDAILTKPYRVEDVRAAVAEAIRARSAGDSAGL